MSIFKEHKTTADRSATDRRRHREKIDKAIKEGIHDIVAEESIIGKSGKKKIKIPVKGIKEYQFIFGKNTGSKGVGSAQGQDIKKGQVIKLMLIRICKFILKKDQMNMFVRPH